MHMDHGMPASWAMARQATLHSLTGCAIGEVLGMVIGTALGWPNLATVVLSVALAFLFGYSLTIAPVLRSGLRLGAGPGCRLRGGHRVDHRHGDRRQRHRAADPGS